MDLLIDFARIGVGIACVIKSFVKEDLSNGTLVEIPLPFPIQKREIGFAYKSNLKSSKSLEEFVGSLGSSQNHEASLPLKSKPEK